MHPSFCLLPLLCHNIFVWRIGLRSLEITFPRNFLWGPSSLRSIHFVVFFLFVVCLIIRFLCDLFLNVSRRPRRPTRRWPTRRWSIAFKKFGKNLDLVIDDTGQTISRRSHTWSHIALNRRHINSSTRYFRGRGRRGAEADFLASAAMET